MVAFSAVKRPALVTWKGAELNVLLPKCIPSAVLKETLVAPVPAINESAPKVKPPIVPEDDVIAPDTVAPVAVITPEELTVKAPDPMFMLPAVIDPKSADIADRSVTLISLAVIALA